MDNVNLGQLKSVIFSQIFQVLMLSCKLILRFQFQLPRVIGYAETLSVEHILPKTTYVNISAFIKKKSKNKQRTIDPFHYIEIYITMENT